MAGLSLGLAAMQGSPRTVRAPLPAEKAALGVAVFGVPVLMVLAAMTVTGEYRSGMIRTTFMATPNRSLVLVAKAVVAAVFSGVVQRLYGDRGGPGGSHGGPAGGGCRIALSLAAAETWRTVGAIALYGLLTAVLGVGVGALLRHAAGAVAVLLMWPLVVEPILGNLPNIGPRSDRICLSATCFCSPACSGCIRLMTCRGVNSARCCISRRSSRWCSRRRSWW